MLYSYNHFKLLRILVLAGRARRLSNTLIPQNNDTLQPFIISQYLAKAKNYSNKRTTRKSQEIHGNAKNRKGQISG
jgi:hypothetical protein